MTPAINRLEPTSGAVGTPITIFGQNFGDEQGDNSVSVNGVKVTDYGDANLDEVDQETRNAWALGASTIHDAGPGKAEQGLVGQAAADNVDVTKANAALPNTPAGPKGPPEVAKGDANAPKSEGKPVVPAQAGPAQAGQPDPKPGAPPATGSDTPKNVAGPKIGWSNERITFRIPEGATTGDVVVTVGGVASNGSKLFVTV